MSANNELSAALEDYLETIAQLENDNGRARVTDISRTLGVSKPTVTEAINKLSQMGYVKREKYGPVELTEQGKNIARQTQGKHDVLIKLLNGIFGVDIETAEVDACKMEHSLSEETYSKLVDFVKNYRTK